MAAAVRLTVVSLALTLVAAPLGTFPAQAVTASVFTASPRPSATVVQFAPATILGRLTPGGHRTYHFQKLVSGSWRTIHTGRTHASGYTRLSVSTARTGSFTYRYCGSRTSRYAADCSNRASISVRPGRPYRAGTQTIGYSVAGRPISLTVVGSPTAGRRAVFVGAIHGNERGGVPVTRALARSRTPKDVAYFVITYPNPDGAARNTRKNRRGVDLNRNFPGWVPGSRGSVYYPGAGPLSEPESRVMYRAIHKIRPTVFVTYHQQMNLVDFCGGNKAAQVTYARSTRMRLTQLTRNRGSQATWLHAAYPRTTVMTVELPSRVSSAMIRRHLRAARYLAAHH